MSKHPGFALSIRALALVAGLLLASLACDSGPKPSGLVLVTVDTLRADALGVYGGGGDTPQIDRLAGDGVLVERAFTPTPTTGPAHASLFTGRHPWRHGVLDNVVALDETLPTLAEALQRAGHRTGAFVSSFILHPKFRFDRGFDDYFFEGSVGFRYQGHLVENFFEVADATTRRARHWLKDATRSGAPPFFLWVHYFDPHAPYRPPPEFTLDPSVPVDLPDGTLPAGLESPAQLAEIIRAYRGEVRFVDAQVGVLMETLVELGVDDRTTLVFTSDHGEGLGDHGHLKHGWNLFDELVRVPLILRGPGLPAGRRIRGHAQLEDLFPTLLSLAGVPPVEGLDGFDLAPWLRGQTEESPRPAVLGRRRIYAGAPDLFYQVAWPHKWIGEVQVPGRRFDLSRDSAELAPEADAEMPATLRASLSGEGAARGEARAAELDDETQRALEALGYVDEADRKAAP